MADVVDRKTRSRMMAGIKGWDTRPELALRRSLHRLGFRYRLHVADLPGRPDIVLPKHRAVVQVQGCFWHRHENCSFATNPASNIPFWESKFSGNVNRDRKNLAALLKQGWRVAVVWECSIRKKSAETIAQNISAWLRSGRKYTEISKAERTRSTETKRLGSSRPP